VASEGGDAAIKTMIFEAMQFYVFAGEAWSSKFEQGSVDRRLAVADDTRAEPCPHLKDLLADPRVSRKISEANEPKHLLLGRLLERYYLEWKVAMGWLSATAGAQQAMHASALAAARAFMLVLFAL